MFVFVSFLADDKTTVVLSFTSVTFASAGKRIRGRNCHELAWSSINHELA